MRIFSVILSVFLLLGTCSADTAVSTGLEPQQAFDMFLENLQAGMYEDALELYEMDRELYDNNDIVVDFRIYGIYAAGLCDLKQGKLDEALSGFQYVQRTMVGEDGTVFPEQDGLVSCETLIIYTAGRIAERDGNMEEAIADYSAVRSVLYNYGRPVPSAISDTITRLMDCNDRVQPVQERYVLAGSEAEGDSIAVSWTDSAGAENYFVSWTPVGIKAGGSEEVAGLSFTAGSLIPDTEYKFSVMAADDAGSKPLTFTLKTGRVSGLTGAISRDSRCQIWTCEARRAETYTYQQMIDRGMLTQAAASEEGRSIIKVNRNFAKGYYLYDFRIQLMNSDSGKKEFDWALVLRMPDELGTYTVSGTSDAPRANRKVGESYYFPMASLLSAYFENFDGEWIESAGKVELYIDGMFVDEAAVVIGLE